MTGKYTVNEVEERTQVPASTLRQWERRYGFPMPERSSSGYRLYSEHDLQQIQAMKRHIEDGVPASRAAELVKRVGITPTGPRPVSELLKELTESLVALDDVRADQILSEAHALHPVETVLVDLLQATMVEIGQRWHDGDLSITVEHFATAYVQGRLRALFNLSPNIRSAKSVVVACAPEDRHELGALTLAVFLRRAGFRVYYVGADTPVADLLEMTQRIKPDAVMVSASVLKAIRALHEQKEHFAQMKTVLVFGGQAFAAQPDLASYFKGRFLGNDVRDITTKLGDILNGLEV